MKMEIRSKEGRDFWIGLVVSVALHGVVILLVTVLWVLDQVATPEDDHEESVEVILEDSAPPKPVVEALSEEPLQEPGFDEMAEDEELLAEQQTDAREEEEPEQEEEEELIAEEEETDDAADEQLFDEELMELYAVDQQTNEEEPVEADHISDEAHQADEEIIADVTTLEDVPHPEEDPEAPEEDADTDLELAMQTPQELSEPDLLDPSILEETQQEEEQVDDEELALESEDEDEPTDDEEQEDESREEVAELDSAREYRDPSEMLLEDRTQREDAPRDSEQPQQDQLFGRDFSQAEKLYGAREDEPGSESSGARAPQGRRLLSSWRENEEAMRASLENFLPHVETGNHTSVNARSAAHASYIARMHRSIHAAWALGFIPRVQSAYSNRDPINDMSLKAVVEIVIDAESGKVLETGLASPSSHTLFNAEALTISRNIGDQPQPPSSIVSPDGKVYVHWTFWRDQRQCGTFGVRIFRLQDEGERREVQGEWGEEES